MTLGQKIRQTRQEKGFSQAQAAAGCVTRNMLSQIENDQAQPSMRTLEHLAQVLDVSVGWLLSDEQTDAALERLRKAKTCFKEGDFDSVLRLFSGDNAPGDDETLLLCAACAAKLAERALSREDFAGAAALSRQSLEWNRKSLYESAELEIRTLGVLARCALETGAAEAEIEAFRGFYLAHQSAVSYHLLLARYQLRQEHIQAAEREIWSIAELPEESRGEYLILRGKIAIRREQFENAALYLHQAEELELGRALERELYQGLEVCCRELGDYQQAYLYASKQLAMQKGEAT